MSTKNDEEDQEQEEEEEEQDQEDQEQEQEEEVEAEVGEETGESPARDDVVISDMAPPGCGLFEKFW